MESSDLCSNAMSLSEAITQVFIDEDLSEFDDSDTRRVARNSQCCRKVGVRGQSPQRSKTLHFFAKITSF